MQIEEIFQKNDTDEGGMILAGNVNYRCSDSSQNNIREDANWGNVIRMKQRTKGRHDPDGAMSFDVAVESRLVLIRTFTICALRQVRTFKVKKPWSQLSNLWPKSTLQKRRAFQKYETKIDLHFSKETLHFQREMHLFTLAKRMKWWLLQQNFGVNRPHSTLMASAGDGLDSTGG